MEGDPGVRSSSKRELDVSLLIVLLVLLSLVVAVVALSLLPLLLDKCGSIASVGAVDPEPLDGVVVEAVA